MVLVGTVLHFVGASLLLGVAAVLPVVFSFMLFSKFFPVRRVGELRFHAGEMIFALDGEEAWAVDLKQLKRMRVSVEMIHELTNRPYREIGKHRAYVLGIHDGSVLREFLVLNELHAGPNGQVPVGRDPRLLTSTLEEVGKQYGLTFHGRSGTRHDGLP